MKYFLGGSMTGNAYQGRDLYFTTNTLTDSSIDITAQVEEAIGQNGVFIGQFPHSARMNVTLTDQLFDLKYLAANVGSTVEIGTDAQTEEQVTLAAGGVGTITGTPIPFGAFGTIGWVSDPNDTNINPVTVTFTDKTFTYPAGQEGQVVCVRYTRAETGGEQFTVRGEYIPQVVHLILEGNLYLALADASDTSSSSVVGKVIVDIPKFVFDASVNLSLTNTGISTTPLSGKAMAVPSTDCAGGLSYATIKVVLNNANWYDNITRLAVLPATPAITVGEKIELSVMGVGAGYAPYNIPANAGLTFTSGTPATATVDNTGAVTAVAAGETDIQIAITDKPSVTGVAHVTVTAA